MHQAWHHPVRGNTPRPPIPIGPPKPSPQQTPGKPKPPPVPPKPQPTQPIAAAARKLSVKPRAPSPSPWDEAKYRVSNQQNRSMVKLQGKGTSYTAEMAGLFSLDEVHRLGMRFRKLDMDSSGSLSLDEFMNLPELGQNPLVQRVVEIFDVDRNGEVDFKEFIHGISHFTIKGNKDKRLRFAFRIYDMDNDGFISNGELFQVMKMMVGTSMVDMQLQHIVDTTILLGDKDEDGKISFEEFAELVNNGSDIHKKMIIEGI